MRKTVLLVAALILTVLSLPAEEQVHVLRRGETIYTLARRYGVSADSLIDFNDIADPTRLPVGAEIRIPGTYRVRQGEYIYSIARDLGVDWLELLRINGLARDDVVRPGDVLLVPGGVEGSRIAMGEQGDSRETQGSVNVTSVNGESSADDARDDGSVSDEDATAVGGDPAAPGFDPASYEWPHPGQREAWDGRFRGVVMAGAPGDVFRSVTSGVVSFVGPFTSFGKLILVRSANGYLYGYAGADTVNVAQGDRVTNGTVLGSVGISPAFNSARVLFTVWRDNRYIDPASAPRG